MRPFRRCAGDHQSAQLQGEAARLTLPVEAEGGGTDDDGGQLFLLKAGLEQRQNLQRLSEAMSSAKMLPKPQAAMVRSQR